jgi:hypothetical protein
VVPSMVSCLLLVDLPACENFLRTYAAVVAPIIGCRFRPEFEALSMVPEDSSAARMTRPGATIRVLIEPD